MYTIGLTGSIGAGKSTVARYLEKIGHPVIDADRLGHEAYLPNTSCYHNVVNTFGHKVVDNEGFIDRDSLAKIVFADPNRLQELNAIVWPEIKRLAKTRLLQMKNTHRHTVVFLDAAVLIEAKWDTIVDEVWTILADSSLALNRGSTRDDSTKAHIKKRLDSQISNDIRVRRSDVVIFNNGTLSELYCLIDQEITKLYERNQGDD